MLKVGDIVRIRDISNVYHWYTTDKYKIMIIDCELCKLYNLTIDDFDDEPIHLDHLEIDIKGYRKMKLEKLSGEK